LHVPKNSTGGFPASAIAMLSRRFAPPESVEAALLKASPSRPTFSASRRASTSMRDRGKPRSSE